MMLFALSVLGSLLQTVINHDIVNLMHAHINMKMLVDMQIKLTTLSSSGTAVSRNINTLSLSHT